jgi:formylglycine-generating enzyme required for sulfatase activity
VPYNAINVNQLLEELDGSKSRVNIVMLDACRNNPISGKFRSGASRGLAAPASMPKGTVIVYATDPGNVAADGNGRNGLFTSGLLAAFRGNDLTLGGVLYQASKQVQDASGQQQTPYINGPPTVQREFSFAPGGAQASEPPQQVAMAPRPQAPPPKLSSSLDDIIASSEAAEQAKKAKAAQVKADLAKYKKIIASRPELKQAAWDALISNHSEARSVPTGNVSAFMKALGQPYSENFTDATTGMQFVGVPEGCNTLGSSQVCLDAFSIGKYEVTQGQWKRVMGSNPSHFSSCGDNCPVEKVSWNDIQQFIQRLNQQSGINYRLPTEAEWEYACRAGGTEEYCGSNNVDAVAWYSSNSGSQTHPVGQKQANAWGLHDMSGNVWEWVSDWYGSSYPTDTRNPTGAASGSDRVNRGGGWNDEATGARAAIRDGSTPGGCRINLGFRLASPVQ